MTLLSTRLTAVLGTLAVCAVLAAPPARAEPLSVGALGTPEPAAGKQIQEVQDAVEAFKKYQFDKAVEFLREAVKKHADLPPAHVIMAQLFAQINQAGAIRSSLERAVVEAPNDPEAYVILGDFALRERNVTEAALLFGMANSLMAGFNSSAERKKALEPRIYGGLAAVSAARAGLAGDDTATEKKEWAAAQKHLEAWLKIEKDEKRQAVALQRLARALFKQGEAQTALNKLKEAHTANPDVLHYAAQMALLYAEADDQENAKTWFDFALRSAPRDLQVWLLAAQWSIQIGQIDQAKTQAATAMQIDEKSVQAMILRGVVALFQKDYATAETYFQSANVQSPANLPASNNLALALCEQDDPVKRRRALEYATNNVRQNQRSAEAWSTYGWVQYKLGNLSEAEQALRKAISGGRFSADTAYYYARVLQEQNKPESAKQFLEAALKSKRPFSKEQEAKVLLEQIK